MVLTFAGTSCLAVVVPQHAPLRVAVKRRMQVRHKYSRSRKFLQPTMSACFDI